MGSIQDAPGYRIKRKSRCIIPLARGPRGVICLNFRSTLLPGTHSLEAFGWNTRKGIKTSFLVYIYIFFLWL